MGRVGVEQIAEAVREQVAGIHGDLLGLRPGMPEPHADVVSVLAIIELEPLERDGQGLLEIHHALTLDGPGKSRGSGEAAGMPEPRRAVLTYRRDVPYLCQT